jgi:EAL domain-containing protein (putative c-di-GMP-specific phosphodiesterase class I)/GGDEF domain-containing protein
MRLADVLKLPKQPHSLSIIKDFLEQSLSHHDYQAAFSHYFEIALSLEAYDMVASEGIRVIKDIQEQTDTPHTEKIIKSVIHACLKIGKLEEAKTFIELRKEKLPMLKQYLGILDDIEYKKAIGLPYLEDLQKVLSDVIPDSTKVYCHQELFKLYDLNKDYDLALQSIYELYNYDLKNDYFNHELRLLLLLGRVDDAQKKAYQEVREKKGNIYAVLVLLECYIRKGDLYKASNLEAEYEEDIDKQEDSFRKTAYEKIIDLYKAMDNKLSLDLYQKKLKSIAKSIDKKVKTVEEKKVPEVVFIEKVEKKESVRQDLFKTLEISHDLIEYSHLIDEKLPLRDYLRVFFMHVESYIKPKDFIIYLHNESPNLFHYKKERLYDKTIISSYLEDTIVDVVMKSGHEIIGEAVSLKAPKNIITQKTYEDDVMFVYAFPLSDEGVFVIHFEEEIKDPGIHYDLLKLMGAILFAHLQDEKKLSKLKNENRYYQSVLNAPILAYREHRETRSTYNEEAMKLFGIERHLHIELFLRDVSYEYVNLYKDTLKKLMMRSGEQKELLYTYQEKHILEKMYSLKIGDDIVVMSIFFDQTKSVTETKDLMDKATVDPDTGLSNLYQFHLSFAEELKDKASLILIELSEELKHIYGTDKILKYFKEFSQHTKKFFNEGNTYRYDFNQLVVVLPYNDIRSVTKIVKDYVRYLDHYESKILKYEKFNVNMGILRYPVVTVEKDPEKIMRYLDIALEKAKRDKEEKYVFFVYRDYEDELFEQTVIDHLNVAIEEKSLGLVFNQITDVKKNRVWQYESELALLNLSIDNKYLLQIAKKRNRLIDLERFHIRRVCEFLVDLEKQTERLIKLTIPISKETFLDPTFNPFVLGLFKEYGIPYEFVRIKCDMDLRANQYSAQIQELIDHGISLDTTSVDMALYYPFHALHMEYRKESVKWNGYLTHLKSFLDGFNMALVIRGVKTKDQKEALERIGIQYMEGPLYKELPAPTLIQKIKETL